MQSLLNDQALLTLTRNPHIMQARDVTTVKLAAGYLLSSILRPS